MTSINGTDLMFGTYHSESMVPKITLVRALHAIYNYFKITNDDYIKSASDVIKTKDPNLDRCHRVARIATDRKFAQSPDQMTRRMFDIMLEYIGVTVQSVAHTEKSTTISVIRDGDAQVLHHFTFDHLETPEYTTAMVYFGMTRLELEEEMMRSGAILHNGMYVTSEYRRKQAKEEDKA